MYSAKCDRAEATGNVDAKLNNAIDWGESGTHFAWWQEHEPLEKQGRLRF